jgi:hypothetical protein
MRESSQRRDGSLVSEDMHRQRLGGKWFSSILEVQHLGGAPDHQGIDDGDWPCLALQCPLHLLCLKRQLSSSERFNTSGARCRNNQQGVSGKHLLLDLAIPVLFVLCEDPFCKPQLFSRYFAGLGFVALFAMSVRKRFAIVSSLTFEAVGELQLRQISDR